MIASVVRVPWHSTHGGYDRLLNYLPDLRPVIPPVSRASRCAYRMIHHLVRRRCPLPFYPAEHCATDLRVLASPSPAHILYGEEQFWYARHRRAATVVTYHQPPSRLATLLTPAQWRALLARADEVVVLDPHQQRFFSTIVAPERVTVVPHGIDLDAFTPGARMVQPGRPMVLTVGWWLRDWPTLDAIHDRLHRQYGGAVDLVVVTRRADTRRWHPGARVIEGIGEPDLINLYRQATLLLLPLHDATANNALLEAMACGTPVVATDIGGISHYAGQSPAVWLVPPGDASAAVQAVEELLAEMGTPAHLQRRTAARHRAEYFAWPLVAAQLRTVYQRLEHR